MSMAEENLNGAEIHSGFQQVSGKGVPQRMRMNRLGDAGVLPGFLAGAEDGLARDCWWCRAKGPLWQRQKGPWRHWWMAVSVPAGAGLV